MDKITHEIRLNNWKKIVEECNNRPNGTTDEQMLAPGDFSRSRAYRFLTKSGSCKNANTSVDDSFVYSMSTNASLGIAPPKSVNSAIQIAIPQYGAGG